MKIVTCIAPVNIAVIKYWGKRNEKLILPLNDSVSGTLSCEQMHAKTTIMASQDFTEDKLWLNGKEESFDNPRLQNCLREIKRKMQESDCKAGDCVAKWHIHVCSENNFPTAAGLASSAAGYACLVYSLAQLYDIRDGISLIARQGSGSACRSVYGGFVRWHAGTFDDGSDSIATQIVPADHWSEMRVLILVVNDARKTTSSTSGMQRSVKTSELLQHRVKNCVPARTEAIIKAIKEKNFHTFAEITMKDSNQFHAVCQDTYPPCRYMNDVSHSIVNLIHFYNDYRGVNEVAYTFDAGPNACLYLLETSVPTVAALINYAFPSEGKDSSFFKGLPMQLGTLSQEMQAKVPVDTQPNSLKYIIHTRLGDGPQILSDPSQHLLTKDGEPKVLQGKC